MRPLRSILLFLILASPAGAQTPFAVDPARSSLAVEECTFNQTRGGFVLASAPLTSAGRATLTGVVVVNFDNPAAPTSLTFTAQSSIKVAEGVNAAPSTKAGNGSGPGGSGEFPANFGLQGKASDIPVNAAVSGLVFALQSGTLPLAAGSFASTGLTFETTGGDLGYRGNAGGAIGTIRGGGPLGRLLAANAATTAGAYSISDGVATLTVPVDVSITLTSTNAQGLATAKVRLTGVIVATAPKP